MDDSGHEGVFVSAEIDDNVIATWQRIYDSVRPKLCADKKPARDVLAFAKKKYPLERVLDEQAIHVAAMNAINQPLNKKKEGFIPNVEVYRLKNEGAGKRFYDTQFEDMVKWIEEVRLWAPDAELPVREDESSWKSDILLNFDFASDYVYVEGSQKLQDELFLFQGLGAEEIDNLYLVFRYARLKGMINTRRIGLVTGLGPASSVDYYIGLIDGYRARLQTEHYPEIVMFNVDMTRMFDYTDAGEYDAIADYFAESIERLKAAGATSAAICCNTLHIVFDRLQQKASLPMISIIEATCDEIQRRGYKKVLLFGTLFTMQSDLYTKPLAARGVDVILPDDAQKQAIQDIIFPELEEGVVDPEKKKVMLSIANEIIDREQPEALILGCTELPLMIKPGDLPIELLNTTEIHVSAILDYLTD